MLDLVKEALSPAVMAGMTRSLHGFGSGAGMGAAVGGLTGGALGAVRGYQQRRDSGGSVMEGLQGGLKGVFPGAGKGAILGAAAGGALGAARPAYAEALAPHLRGSSNFGQRQVHALTGVGDTKYLRSVGGGAADAEQRLARATTARGTAAPGKKMIAAERELGQARKGLQASEKSEQMGLYSLPGYARALGKHPVEALKTGINDQWQNMGTGGRALMYGLPAVGVAQELSHGNDREGSLPGRGAGSAEGKGRFERAGRLAGVAGSGMLAPFAIGGDLAAGGMLTSAVGAGGKLLDRSLARLKQRRQPSRVSAASAPDPAGGDSQASAHIFSDRAAGVVPEGITG